jgi:AhpD family alkylhydroperoxidase
MNHPAMILPGAMQALQALSAATDKAGLSARTLELVHLRASQINGCSVCLDMHSQALRKHGKPTSGCSPSPPGATRHISPRVSFV